MLTGHSHVAGQEPGSWPATIRQRIGEWMVLAARAGREASRYLSGSDRSRIRQLERLQDLDDWLLRDIGMTRGHGRRAAARSECSVREINQIR